MITLSNAEKRENKKLKDIIQMIDILKKEGLGNKIPLSRFRDIKVWPDTARDYIEIINYLSETIEIKIEEISKFTFIYLTAKEKKNDKDNR